MPGAPGMTRLPFRQTQRGQTVPSCAADSLALFRSVTKNKFCDRQIARISDFEIKIVVDNESDFVAESFDCGDLVSYPNTFRVNSAIGLLD
jgi:hypothetical protein